MHWLKLFMEVWFVFGVVTVVAGMIWTTRLSRNMNPEIGNISPLPERQLATASVSHVHST